METLFPSRPEDITVLGEQELADLLASFQDVSRRLRAGEIDLSEIAAYAELSEDERSTRVMEDWREAATFVQTIRDRQGELASASREGLRVADELAASIEGEDAEEADAPEGETAAEGEELAAESDEDDDEDDDDEDDPEALAAESDEEPVVTASSAALPVRYPAVARRHSERDQREAAEHAGAVMVASAGSRSIERGTTLTADDYATLAAETIMRGGPVVHTKGGGRERILLAAAQYDFPEDFRLRARDPEGNREKLAAVGNPYFAQEALVASGGICAPPTPFYDLPNFSVTSRPVRDSLPSFQADRGGVSVPSVSTLSSVGDSITVIEAAEDAGGTITKSCMPIDCAEWTDTFIGAISHCREIGVFNARTWPEGVAHENANTMALHARTAEGRLLDRIDALSLDLSRSAVYGSSASLLYALSISRVGIISRLRMDPDTRFNVILPFWAATNFALDIVNGATEQDRFAIAAAAEVSALLSRFGFNVTWHLDEGIAGSADTEIWPDETDGTEQEDWPGAQIVVARLAPAGHFVHLDGGTLELGLIRDADLVASNDYELFGETFENVFAVGPTQAAHRLEITMCPSGNLALDTTPITCSAT